MLTTFIHTERAVWKDMAVDGVYLARKWGSGRLRGADQVV